MSCLLNHPSFIDKGLKTMEKLQQYVIEHTIRGACQCGQCIDKTTDEQPKGHTADLVFFQVANKDGDAVELRKLIDAANGEFNDVNLFDGQEHGYMEIGGWIGDQGLAMQLMGLGSILGLWQLLTPKIFGMDGDMAMQLAGMGMITIIAK